MGIFPSRAPVAQWSTGPSGGPKSVGLSSRRSPVRIWSGAFLAVPGGASFRLCKAKCGGASKISSPPPAGPFHCSPFAHRYISATKLAGKGRRRRAPSSPPLKNRKHPATTSEPPPRSLEGLRNSASARWPSPLPAALGPSTRRQDAAGGANRWLPPRGGRAHFRHKKDPKRRLTPQISSLYLPLCRFLPGVFNA